MGEGGERMAFARVLWYGESLELLGGSEGGNVGGVAMSHIQNISHEMTRVS